MVVALPASSAKLNDISEGVLIHIAPLSRRDQIVSIAGQETLPKGTNCTVHIKAGQGWSVAPFRLLRDSSVADPYLTHLKDYGHYSYFFVGTPGWWALKKNIGPGARWGDLGPDKMVITVPGDLVVNQKRLLFYRPDDKVLIMRGDYQGPALVED